MSSTDRDDLLVVILEGRPIGRIERSARGLLLTYDDDYLDDPAATILATAMPPPLRTHPDRVLTPWLWGLLPDDPEVLRRWGREFEVATGSPYPLLATPLGHDCAGAVQFCRPGEVGDLIDRPGAIEPLSDAQVAERLRLLRRDRSAWLGPDFSGQFSLGGVQAKTALAYDSATGWGAPRGSAPTTHILKPAIEGLDGHDLNEHLCLTAARACGLPAARSQVSTFEDQSAVVIERYDRRVVDGEIARVHQEDLGQALAISPAAKYQADGGPSVADVAELLRAVMPAGLAAEATYRFVDALAFNWLIAGTDAHAKNYSLLHAGNQTRLAPLYDLASALPYDTSEGHKLKLAMKLGGEYRLRVTDRTSTWPTVAHEVGLPPDDVVSRVARLAGDIGPAFAGAAADPTIAAIPSDLPRRLADAVTSRAERCAKFLTLP